MAAHRPFPTWLEFSGLPRHLNTKAGLAGWCVFQKIVALDSERNHTPDAVEISVSELAERTGVTPVACRRILDKLRRAKVLLVFVPDTDDEPALLQVRVPLPTPIPVEEVARAHPELHLLELGANDRYAREEAPVDPEDPQIRAVVDLYLNSVGPRVNSFVLDELIFVARRHPLRDIERVFRQARHLPGPPGLGWIARQLSRRHAAKGQKKPARPRR